jgi:hypothetical protein
MIIFFIVILCGASFYAGYVTGTKFQSEINATEDTIKNAVNTIKGNIKK